MYRSCWGVYTNAKTKGKCVCVLVEYKLYNTNLMNQNLIFPSIALEVESPKTLQKSHESNVAQS